MASRIYFMVNVSGLIHALVSWSDHCKCKTWNLEPLQLFSAETNKVLTFRCLCDWRNKRIQTTNCRGFISLSGPPGPSVTIPHYKYIYKSVSVLGEANNEIQWSRLNGQTPSTNTGPTNDHTQNNGWYFVFSYIKWSCLPTFSCNSNTYFRSVTHVFVVKFFINYWRRVHAF